MISTKSSIIRYGHCSARPDEGDLHGAGEEDGGDETGPGLSSHLHTIKIFCGFLKILMGHSRLKARWLQSPKNLLTNVAFQIQYVTCPFDAAKATA
jgi:hypothetical protein